MKPCRTQAAVKARDDAHAAAAAVLGAVARREAEGVKRAALEDVQNAALEAEVGKREAADDASGRRKRIAAGRLVDLENVMSYFKVKKETGTVLAKHRERARTLWNDVVMAYGGFIAVALLYFLVERLRSGTRRTGPCH